MPACRSTTHTRRCRYPTHPEMLDAEDACGDCSSAKEQRLELFLEALLILSVTTFI